ncbi:MAG: hypothetical protein KDD50_13875 [Bdellovibrionales bacterium]|nr:hypothetical protein [Bdellovibrionales bacterium]
MFRRNFKILRWFIFVGGILGFLYFSFGIFVGMSSGDAIRNSQKILDDFKRTASFIDTFKKSNLRLPTQAEIEIQFGENYSISITDFHDIEKPKFLMLKPADSYILHYWRGEWAEYYAGWNQQTTLSIKESDYYPFHSPILAVIVVIASLLICFIGFKLKSDASKTLLF